MAATCVRTQRPRGVGIQILLVDVVTTICRKKVLVPDIGRLDRCDEPGFAGVTVTVDWFRGAFARMTTCAMFGEHDLPAFEGPRNAVDVLLSGASVFQPSVLQLQRPFIRQECLLADQS